MQYRFVSYEVVGNAFVDNAFQILAMDDYLTMQFRNRLCFQPVEWEDGITTFWKEDQHRYSLDQLEVRIVVEFKKIDDEMFGVLSQQHPLFSDLRFGVQLIIPAKTLLPEDFTEYNFRFSKIYNIWTFHLQQFRLDFSLAASNYINL